MSCCQRSPAPLPARWPAAGVEPAPPLATVAATAGLRFDGPHALSLPLGTRRVLVTPGQTVTGLSAGERERLLRTGLFTNA